METHLRALCEGLHSRVDISVLVSNTGRATRRELVNGVDVTRLGTLATLASAPLNPGLAGRLRESEADIVHLHLPHPGAVIAYLASRTRARLFITYHSDIVRQRILGRFFEPLLHRALSRAETIICTSPNYIESSPMLRRHRDRCVVIPFSIPLEALLDRDLAAEAQLRRTYGSRIVLAIGRLVGYKGYEYLVDAMQWIEGRLLIIGDGPLREPLRQRAAARGVATRVSFLGQVPRVSSYLHASDVFVLPSIARSEAFGLVQLEAMACAKPVVNTALASGVPYVSPHGETGLTVAPEDAKALAAAVNTLLDDERLRSVLGEAGRRRLESHFSVEGMLAQTENLYRRAVYAAQ